MAKKDIKEDIVVNYFKEHPDMFITEISIMKIEDKIIKQQQSSFLEHHK